MYSKNPNIKENVILLTKKILKFKNNLKTPNANA